MFNSSQLTLISLPTQILSIIIVVPTRKTIFPISFARDFLPTLKSNTSTIFSTESNRHGLRTQKKPRRGLFEGIYKTIMRRNSVYVTFVILGTFAGERMRRKLQRLVGDEPNVASVFGSNFSAGFVAGTLAAGATCPLDVVKTRRQIEKNPVRASQMTTRKTLVEILRSGGMKGLFTGVSPRVGRAGPSVGVVVSFYEVVKFVLHQQYAA